jgi:hypothetical protein
MSAELRVGAPGIEPGAFLSRLVPQIPHAEPANRPNQNALDTRESECRVSRGAVST